MMVKTYPLPLILIVRRVLVENETVEDGHSSAAGGSSTNQEEHPSPQSSQFSLLDSPSSRHSDKSAFLNGGSQKPKDELGRQQTSSVSPVRPETIATGAALHPDHNMPYDYHE